MKKMIFLVILGFSAFVSIGCEKNGQFGFSSGDCNEVYTNCVNKCVQSNKSRIECTNSCERGRGMCASIKLKGCTQDCNKNYGKGTPEAESCKNRCTSGAN